MESLTEQDTYRSPGRRISWFTRTFPSLVFYPGMGAIVLKASRIARKGMYDTDEWVRSSLDVVKLFESLGTVFEIEGTSAFKKLNSPCVFISNHMSTLETFVLPCIIQPHIDVTFVVKDSLVKTPVFKHVMISRDPVVVGRSNPREDLKIVLEEGAKRLKNNISVIIFPQTTRSAYLDPKKFNSIGVKLARRAGVPVVPVAVKSDVWALGRWIKDLGRIYPVRGARFSFGNPMTIESSGREEQEAIIDFISGNLRKWADQPKG